jgi:hypothetical protein
MECEPINAYGVGEGNWVTALYAVRLAARFFQVDVLFQCSDAQATRRNMLLPWFNGYWPWNEPADDGRNNNLTEWIVCNNRYKKLRIDTLARQIQKDVQQMAVKLVGSTEPNESLHSSIITSPESSPPLFSNIELDQVAIHFRCGDAFGGAKKNDYGVIKFSEYKKWIAKNGDTKTIGIVTQPFEKHLIFREQDAVKVDECRQATTALVDYLQDFLPEARIRIHNTENETLPLAYARLAMAKQSFSSLSSFGAFAVVGTFGQGYIQKGNPKWVRHVPTYLPNIHLMEAPFWGSNMIRQQGLNRTLQWLVSD